jgi:hypothetical protein
MSVRSAGPVDCDVLAQGCDQLARERFKVGSPKTLTGLSFVYGIALREAALIGHPSGNLIKNLHYTAWWACPGALLLGA